MPRIFHEAPQGTQAWLDARLGLPTASGFAEIVTPGGKLSATREEYMGELLAAWLLGYDVSEFAGNEATERGTALEPQAFAAFAFQTDKEPRKVGFVYRDESKLVGCSPDGLVGNDECLELKCPIVPGRHLMYLFRGVLPKAYFCQVQGQLWVTEFKACYFMSFYPGLPPFIIRVQPDEKYQAALDEHMPTFIDELLQAREKFAEFKQERKAVEIADGHLANTMWSAK